MRDVGPFRPLRPFAEADRAIFFGRDKELKELTEKIAGDRPSALLLGEPGVGKTSLVRAGLMPQLKARGTTCAYVDASALQTAQLSQPGPGGALLIIDDLGAALDEGVHLEQLLQLLKKAAAWKGLKVLFVLDDTDLWRLDGLERRIGHVGPSASRQRLERFDEPRAAEVLERTILGGGAFFESGLSAQVAADIGRRGPISPAELQVVAATAVALRLSTSRAYGRAGGAEAILWRFFGAACAAAGGRRAQLALAELAALEPRGVLSTDQLGRAAGVDGAAAERLATAMVGEDLARPAPGGVTLANEWVRAPARAYTGELRGRSVAARLLVRRKLESGGLLAPHQLRRVRQDLGALGADEEKLLHRSTRVAIGGALLLVGLPLVGMVTTYAAYGRASYLGLRGDGPGAPVVVRLGRPHGWWSWLPHWPAFGSVIGDTGFSHSALAGALDESPGAASGDDWLRRLRGGLKPLPEAVVALVQDGDVKLLAKAYETPSLRPAVIDAVAAAGRGSAAEQTLLSRSLGESSEELRRRATLAAGALERRAPGSGAALLRTAVQSGGPAIRMLALAEIDRLPTEQAVPLYAQAVDVGEAPARTAALEALGRAAAQSPVAQLALVSALKGPARAEASALLFKLLDGPAATALESGLVQLGGDVKAPDEARVEAFKLLRHRPTTPAGLAAPTGSPRVQAAALPLLLRAGAEGTADRLAEALRGPRELRAAGAAALGLMPKSEESAKTLKTLLGDSAVEVRVEAVRALPALGRDALPLLAKAAKDGGPDLERAAVETLGTQSGRLGANGAAQALEVIAKTGRPAARRAAMDAIGKLSETKPSTAASLLGQLLRDKAPEVRADAAAALGEVIGRGGKEAIAPLKGAAHDADPVTRRRAAAALGRAKGPLGASAAKALGAFVGDDEASVRVEAALAIGALGDAAAGAGGALAELVGDSDAGVRAAGRRAARELGRSATGLDKVLLQSYGSAPGPEKLDVVMTAGAVGGASVVRLALADADAHVRRAAAESAGGAGAPLVPGLLAALGDRDAAVRVAAVRGLVGAKAVEALALAAASGDREVRIAALEVLGEVGGSVAKSLLDSALSDGSERVRLAAARGLPKLGAEAGPLLERALGDAALDVREAAMLGLGQVWALRPAAELAPVVASETDADRRYAAALALVRQSDPGAAPAPGKSAAPSATAAEAKRALERAAQSGGPAARLTAKVAIAFIGRPDAMAAFLHLLRSGT